MFKIGEFSKLTRVSVKTLRFYDDQGLLAPADVDRYTGYRYYAAAQVPRLHRILFFKDLAFSLEEIRYLLTDEPDIQELAAMLKVKRVALDAQMRAAADRLARVEAHLTLIAKEKEMTAYDVVVKHLREERYVGLRAVIPSYPEQGPLWQELMAHLQRHGVKPVGPCFTMYHDECYKEKDVDAEVGEPIGAALCPETDRIKVRTLPDRTVAAAVHHGPYEGLNAAYRAIASWLEANGYHLCGPDREVYIVGCDRSSHPAQYVTEIQIPITKSP